MGNSNAEADRRAEETYRNRRITGRVYCGQCGYNLRTLPYVYQCPECGNEYNARPLIMHGLFKPHEMAFPFGAYLMALVLAVAAFVFGTFAFSPLKWVPFGFTLVLLALTVVYLAQALVLTRRFFHSVQIARRIEAEERDW